MNDCPRCQKSNIRIEHKGYHNKRLIWTIFNCRSCSFSWRDSEPEATIIHEKRDPFFHVDTDRPQKYPIVLPPGLI
ncbi:non-oxidative hydroxyarylic acid decarboxylases subunit D [Fictibacillus enclensis]|uniref:non-oxidative hydroxyarylic acid decarboxylases subunit D n=1 Tax=Fictibacillus enclensis TaxID=1017270 RepID=UPI00333C1977